MNLKSCLITESSSNEGFVGSTAVSFSTNYSQNYIYVISSYCREVENMIFNNFKVQNLGDILLHAVH